MGRSPCCENNYTNKGSGTQQEDPSLVAHIRAYDERGWPSLPKAAGMLRCRKRYKLRWINYPRPDLKRGNFSKEEDHLIIKIHSLLGNKDISGGTANEIKNLLGCDNQSMVEV